MLKGVHTSVNEETITQSDIVFFTKMTSSFDPITGENKLYNHNNYYKILDKKDSEEFQRFIEIYNKTKHILKERQRQILDDLYGVYKPRLTQKEVSKVHQIGSSRVRKIRVDAEIKLKRYLRGLS